MTSRQAQLLAFINAYIAEKGFSPSFDEMAEHLEVVSKSGVHRIILALEEQGKIRRFPGRARGVEVVGRLSRDGLISRIFESALAQHGMEDDEGILISFTGPEFRAFLAAELP